MKSPSIRYLSFLLLFVLSSCEQTIDPLDKKPVADFNFTLGAEGRVQFANLSQNAKTFAWDFGDQNTSTDRSPQHQYQRNGTFRVSLNVTGDRGTDVLTKSVQITNIPENGQATFWLQNFSGCAAPGITINGETRNITGGLSAAPACGAAGTATFNLRPGTYNYTGACGSTNWNGSVTVTERGCQLVQLSSSAGTTGEAVFWTKTNLNCGTITVTISGQNRTITTFAANEPLCGASGFATFALPAGSYSYTASCTGQTWSGNVTVATGQCQRVELTATTPPAATGNAVFWARTNLGCGTITINVDNQSRTLTSFSSLEPNCGAAGFANFNLPVGSFNYTATCPGQNWSGTVTITANGCAKVELTPNVPASGNAIFWTRADFGCGNITVTINTESRTSTSFANIAPNCGASNFANFTLPAGTYQYTARCTGLEWNGNITVTSGGCVRQELTASTRTFSNSVFTDIRITYNGITKTIEPGRSVVFAGSPNSSGSYRAETSGRTNQGTQVGLLMVWEENFTFPASGNATTNLVLSPSFFFLRVTNQSSRNIERILVNYQLSSQTTDNIVLASGGVTYNVGYYRAFSNSNVRAESGNWFWSWPSPLSGINGQPGQVVTVTAN